MKYFYSYLFGLSLFIILMAWINSSKSIYEGMSNEPLIILLGDSIFKNNIYVKKDESVEYFVDKKSKKSKCLAMDGAIIVDIYNQLDKIPESDNSSDTHLFLSIGGNDIINNYVYSQNNINDKSILKRLIENYSNLIKHIKEKFNLSKISILDIYYPTSDNFKKYYKLIDEWNSFLEKISQDENITLLKISDKLKDPEDFIFEIEPSSNGGKKIADLITN